MKPSDLSLHVHLHETGYWLIQEPTMHLDLIYRRHRWRLWYLHTLESGPYNPSNQAYASRRCSGTSYHGAAHPNPPVALHHIEGLRAACRLHMQCSPACITSLAFAGPGHKQNEHPVGQSMEFRYHDSRAAQPSINHTASPWSISVSLLWLRGQSRSVALLFFSVFGNVRTGLR